ncbi:Methyltransferase [Aphelenchoides fujianensis]|nr:Methyltransferase [Aphelenchoides fujianensis]
MTAVWRNFFKNASADIRQQFACPTRSMTGAFCTRLWERHNAPLIRRVVEEMRIQPDHNILELGFGRGLALRQCYEAVKGGKGQVFGLETSDYMAASTYKNYSVEINESDKIVLDKIANLINLPYPNDIFDAVFHVDVFYFWSSANLPDIFREFHRVLKPGALLLCGLELKRLKRLEKYGVLNGGQFDPLRYMVPLEPSGFRNVKIEYKQLEGEPGREIQLISARKPEASADYYDPDHRMRQLELDIKKHLAMQSLLEAQQRDERLVREAEGRQPQENSFERKAEEEPKKTSGRG